MNDKTLELLKQLADKFGTTVEHLWGVLVKQAVISATVECVMTIATVSAWVWLFRFVRKKTAEPAGSEPDSRWVREGCAEWTEEVAVIAWVFVAVALAFVVAQIYFAVDIGMTAALNPEYWALKQIIP